MPEHGSLNTRVTALIQGRCPRCREGKIFTSILTMNPVCPACGLVFEREPGYFLGAMMFSYAIAVVFCITGYLFLQHLWPQQSHPIRFLELSVLYLPCVPWVFHASRILWIHLDRTVYPQDS